MTSEALLAFVREGGAYCAPLLLLALLWMELDRRRLLKSLRAKDDLIRAKDEKIESLAERVLTVASALNTYLFSRGNGP